MLTANYDASTFDVVVSGVESPSSSIHSNEILGYLLKIVKPNGTLLLHVLIADGESSHIK